MKLLHLIIIGFLLCTLALCSSSHTKADSVIIIDGLGNINIGKVTTSINGENTPNSTDMVVYVVKEISLFNVGFINNMGLKKGFAYRQNKRGIFKELREVDLSLSNEEIAKVFSVEN